MSWSRRKDHTKELVRDVSEFLLLALPFSDALVRQIRYQVERLKSMQ
jgi:hypothetical protein